jgi:aspartate carbamoyltransferase catalytic subunit
VRHILDAQQFNHAQIQSIFHRADEIGTSLRDVARRDALSDILRDRLMFLLFYQPSTRTRISFEVAGYRLGMKVSTLDNAGLSSSAAKDESLDDTVRTLSQYNPDVVVIRHPRDNTIHSAARVSAVPIINAGDGTHQHPTQGLIDLYTILSRLGRMDNLCVSIAADRALTRSGRSLALLLAQLSSNHITFLGPSHLQIDDATVNYLEASSASFDISHDYDRAFKRADVVYWTKIQDAGSSVKSVRFDTEELKTMKPSAILMHPLPRVDEIAVAVDEDPRAAYFEQVRNGLAVRIALLEWVQGSF